MNLGNKIVQIRKDNKLSQEEFAEILNVTRQTISNWENSKNYPDIETLKPGMLIGCTYKDEFIQYNISYNKINKKPSPRGASYSVGKSKEIKNVTKKINNMEVKQFKNINELTEYIKSLYEQAGAKCKVVDYKNSDDYINKVEKMQLEFYDTLENS